VKLRPSSTTFEPGVVVKKLVLITGLAVAALAQAGRLPAQAPEPGPLTCGEVRENSLAASLAKEAVAIDEVRAAARKVGLDSVRGLLYAVPGLGVRVIGGNLPQPLVDSLSGALLEQAAARRSATNPHAALLLRLDPLPLPACGPRPRRESLPRVLNDGEMAPVLRDLTIAGRRAFPDRGPAMLRMVLTREGEVASAQLVSSRSTVQLEEGVLEIARRVRYRPAALDQVPVDVVLFVPIRL
jgi:TonB family protein